MNGLLKHSLKLLKNLNVERPRLNAVPRKSDVTKANEKLQKLKRKDNWFIRAEDPIADGDELGPRDSAKTERFAKIQEYKEFLKKTRSDYNSLLLDFSDKLNRMVLPVAHHLLFEGLCVEDVPITKLSQITILSDTHINILVFDKSHTGKIRHSIEKKYREWTINTDGENKMLIILPRVSDIARSNLKASVKSAGNQAKLSCGKLAASLTMKSKATFTSTNEQLAQKDTVNQDLNDAYSKVAALVNKKCKDIG